ncbi:MAG: hypothetical protein HY761_00260 [Candidatus Omnitrophica bacterium]|nr:hypothetical protein [Candidatus Omnitrophota bacterium]
MDLVGERVIGKDSKQKLALLKPAHSILVLYLGTDGKLSNMPIGTNVWAMPNYDIEKMYCLVDDGVVDDLDCYLLRLMPDKKSMVMLVNAPFKDSDFWRENKQRLIDNFIEKIKFVIPDIRERIVFKDAATPATLYRWTLNYHGSAYGWEGAPSQFLVNSFSQNTFIEGLYLTGHWATLVQGISGVTRLGRDTARIIINKSRRK